MKRYTIAIKVGSLNTKKFVNMIENSDVYLFQREENYTNGVTYVRIVPVTGCAISLILYESRNRIKVTSVEKKELEEFIEYLNAMGMSVVWKSTIKEN